jgi:uncharacterized protein (TIGR02145 family)
MAENLKVTHFSDGANILNEADNTKWEELQTFETPGYCWYDQDIHGALNKDIYGAMYNWYAVNTGRLCPTGWHVPSSAEWDNLVLTLDPEATLDNIVQSEVAGGKLKEAGPDHWGSTNIATNESGFTALP